MDIGEKIKLLRLKNEMTQEELAGRTELTKGFISQVERGITSPSIATLVDILDSLGTNLKDFFNDFNDTKITFTNEDYFVQDDPENGSSISWIVPNAIKNMMEPSIMRLEKGGCSEEHLPHHGEVFGYILKGNATLIFGLHTYQLSAGECFYFQAVSGYQIKNTSDGEVEALWVVTPPNY